MQCDAIAYIEWGGAYDTRELSLVEYQGKFSWEDMTGGYLTLHDVLHEHDTLQDAKQELLSFVFKLGEPATFVDFGDSGIVRACDPYAFQAMTR